MLEFINSSPELQRMFSSAVIGACIGMVADSFLSKPALENATFKDKLIRKIKPALIGAASMVLYEFVVNRVDILNELRDSGVAILENIIE